MKLAVSAALIALIAAPVAAQTASSPAPAVAPAAPAAAAPAATGKYTLDTPIETLVADPAAKAVIDGALGEDITQNPYYEQIKTMGFAQVQPISQGRLSDEVMKKLGDGLATIK